MKRSRAPNYTTAEIMHLLLLVVKFPIIENKKTDAVTSADKQEAWRALAAEYNATTSAGPRTTENLMACYKNQKIKVKKQHSSEKMYLKAPITQNIISDPGPSHRLDDIDIIVNAVEENGQDWELVSQSTNIPPQDCKTTFSKLVRQAQKQHSEFVKETKRTGGGPPPQPPSDEVLEKVKTLIGPSIEGLYTVYVGDFEFMKQQQDLLPQHKQLKPIELNNLASTLEIASPTCSTAKENLEFSPVSRSRVASGFPKRLGLLKKKIDPSLNASPNSTEKKKKTAEFFVELAEDKKEFLRIKKHIADDQLIFQQENNAVSLQIIKEKLDYVKKSNMMELEHQQKIKELELDFLRQKYELELSILKNKQ